MSNSDALLSERTCSHVSKIHLFSSRLIVYHLLASIHQSINQLFNPSINWSISQLINWLIDKSINQSINQSMSSLRFREKIRLNLRHRGQEVTLESPDKMMTNHGNSSSSSMISRNITSIRIGKEEEEKLKEEDETLSACGLHGWQLFRQNPHLIPHPQLDRGRARAKIKLRRRHHRRPLLHLLLCLFNQVVRD